MSNELFVIRNVNGSDSGRIFKNSNSNPTTKPETRIRIRIRRILKSISKFRIRIRIQKFKSEIIIFFFSLQYCKIYYIQSKFLKYNIKYLYAHILYNVKSIRVRIGSSTVKIHIQIQIRRIFIFYIHI